MSAHGSRLRAATRRRRSPLLDGLESRCCRCYATTSDGGAPRRSSSRGRSSRRGSTSARRGTPASLLTAADAFVKASDSSRLRQAAERVLSLGKAFARSRGASTRDSIRARRPSRGWSRSPDARWLASSRARRRRGVDRDRVRSRTSTPAHPLTGQEQLARAQALSDAGSIDDALRAVDDAASAPPPGATHLERMRAKGYILYKSRNRYLEAAKLLGEAAALGGAHAAEDAFHAARALSRADAGTTTPSAATRASRRTTARRRGATRRPTSFVPSHPARRVARRGAWVRRVREAGTPTAFTSTMRLDTARSRT